MDTVLDAVQPSSTALENAIEQVYLDFLPSTATVTGIETWEEILGIIPDLHYQELEDRRATIIRRLSIRTPLTEQWFRNWLDNRFERLFLIDIDYIALVLWLSVPVATPIELQQFRAEVQQIIPINLMLMIRRLVFGYPIDDVKILKTVTTRHMPVQHTEPYHIQPKVDTVRLHKTVVTRHIPVQRTKPYGIKSKVDKVKAQQAIVSRHMLVVRAEPYNRHFEVENIEICKVSAVLRHMTLQRAMPWREPLIYGEGYYGMHSIYKEVDK